MKLFVKIGKDVREVETDNHQEFVRVATDFREKLWAMVNGEWHPARTEDEKDELDEIQYVEGAE